MSIYNQTATYWEPSVLNDHGEQSFISPIQIQVRWEEKTELFIDKLTGKEQRSNSVVFTQQDLIENGFLFLGTSAQANPKDQTKSFLIRRFDKITALRNKKVFRKTWL